MNQNYLMINQNNNVVENIILWNGDVIQWSPPPNYLMLVHTTTPSLVWHPNEENTDWILTQKGDLAQIGFTWNGTECVTNELKPSLASLPTNVANIP